MEHPYIDQPFLSFILPVYNAKPFLAICLHSIFHQTCLDFEIIAIDDGSTDTSFQILELAAKESPVPFHFIYEDNQGVCTARNTGISAARGIYLAFIDCDDTIVPFLCRADKSPADQ